MWRQSSSPMPTRLCRRTGTGGRNFSASACAATSSRIGLETRIARYHNVYGPYGTFDGGREKAPAAICRKVIEAKMYGSTEIEVWGDGEQTRFGGEQ